MPGSMMSRTTMAGGSDNARVERARPVAHDFDFEAFTLQVALRPDVRDVGVVVDEQDTIAHHGVWTNDSMMIAVPACTASQPEGRARPDRVSAAFATRTRA